MVPTASFGRSLPASCSLTRNVAEDFSDWILNDNPSVTGAGIKVGTTEGAAVGAAAKTVGVACVVATAAGVAGATVATWVSAGTWVGIGTVVAVGGAAVAVTVIRGPAPGDAVATA